jgi:hypothetical protein
LVVGGLRATKPGGARGISTEEAEFDTAYGAASALIAAAKQGLKNDPRTVTLGEALTWGKLEVADGADQ